MPALEDAAAAINMDPLEFFLKNLELTGARAQIYRDEFQIAADMIGWKKNWHPRGDKTSGYIKRGLGLSLHTWGGGGHPSNCDLTISPDGSVEVEDGDARHRDRDSHDVDDRRSRHARPAARTRSSC